MRYAIGDIHGGTKTLKGLLARLNLHHADRLFTLGDYVDRGPDSKGVLDTLMELLESGFNVSPLRGNHDDMMLRAISDESDGPSRSWFGDWGESFSITDPKDVPERYVNFLKSLPMISVERDYVLVHAGLAYDSPDPIADSGANHMLWKETGIPDRHKLGGRVVITGHRVHSISDIKLSLESDHIYLDNGAYTGGLPDLGNLVALNLDTKAMILQPWID